MPVGVIRGFEVPGVEAAGEVDRVGVGGRGEGEEGVRGGRG